MADLVDHLEVYLVSFEPDVPYLGALGSGERVNSHGYFVRAGNRTVYPRTHRSLVLRLQTRDGVEGWGETYGLVTPQATAAILEDLIKEFVIGQDPFDVVCIHDDLYDLMRVRGYTGGYYLDALAAVDIALWDIAGKQAGQPLAKLLGGIRRTTIPAYVSGLPRKTLQERCEMAASWQARGFDAVKFALPAAHKGPVRELDALRTRLGADANIACDLHWSYSASDAITVVREMTPYRPWFVEAPVAPENTDGLRQVAEQTDCPIASGEEWRTVFDARPRIDAHACQIVQPEMGHTGVTQFARIAQYAEAHHLAVMPHATIGVGLFLAASLQASAALRNVVCHEYQHSIFDDKQHLLDGGMSCAGGAYQLPSSNGIGVAPSSDLKARLQPLK